MTASCFVRQIWLSGVESQKYWRDMKMPQDKSSIKIKRLFFLLKHELGEKGGDITLVVVKCYAML
jgi:hypothetical protein